MKTYHAERISCNDILSTFKSKNLKDIVVIFEIHHFKYKLAGIRNRTIVKSTFVSTYHITESLNFVTYLIKVSLHSYNPQSCDYKTNLVFQTCRLLPFPYFCRFCKYTYFYLHFEKY